MKTSNMQPVRKAINEQRLIPPLCEKFKSAHFHVHSDFVFGGHFRCIVMIVGMNSAEQAEY